MPASTPVTEFTWAIANLERETVDGFVMTAHYTVNANDGTYSSGAYGSIGFERPDNLIPFADLTEELVVGWVKEPLAATKRLTKLKQRSKLKLTSSADPAKPLVCPGADATVNLTR